MSDSRCGGAVIVFLILVVLYAGFAGG